MKINENRIAAIVGIIIGCVLGYFMSLSMIREHNECEVLRQENKMMQDMLYEVKNNGQ
jgi:uncharacterized membrane protein